MRRIAAADRRVGYDAAKLGSRTLPALTPQSTYSRRSGATRKLDQVAPWLALALLVLLGGEFVSVSIERLLGIHQYSLTPQALMAIVTARDAAQLCLALFGVYAILQAPLTSIGLRLPKVGGLAIGVAIGLATGLVFPRLVHDILRLQSSYTLQYDLYIMSQATGLTAAALVFVYLFLGPIVEEIVFRGIVVEGLSKVTNGMVAVVVSAVIFAGMHAVGGIALMTAAFLSGLLYGWLYLRTRSIVPSSVAHVIYDTVVFYPLIAFMLRAKHF